MPLARHNRMAMSLSRLIDLFFKYFFFAFTRSYEGFIFISLLGVSASGSPPFPSGLVLVLISKNKIFKKAKFTHMVFVELKTLRKSWKLINTNAIANTIKQFVQQIKYFTKS